MWKMFDGVKWKNKKMMVLIFLLLLVRLSLLSVFSHYCYMCYSASLQGMVAANLLDGKLIYTGGYSSVDKMQTETGKLVDIQNVRGDVNPQYGPFVGNMPGYGILLAFFWGIFGAKLYIFAQVFQIFLDVLALLAFYYIARKIFGEKAAMLSGIIYVFFAPVALITVVAFRNIFPFFASIFVAYLIFRTVEDKSVNRVKYYFLAGIIAGIFTWLRETNAALPVFFGLVILFEYGKKEWIKATAIMLFGVLLVLSPWIIRNYVVFHEFIPLSTEMGAGWVAGFGEYTNPWGMKFDDGAAYDYVVSRGYAGSSDMLSPEFDIAAKKVAISLILEQPGLYTGDVAKRLVRGLFLQPNPQVGSYLLSYRADILRKIAVAAFSLFSLLSATYIFLLRKIKGTYLLLVLLPMIYFPVIYAPFNMGFAHVLAGAWSYYLLASWGLIMLWENRARLVVIKK